MFIFLSLIFLVVSMIYFFFFFLSLKNILMKEKLSPFECGFDPFSLSRVSFSLKFFFIAIIFLIFDVEIIIVLPFPLLLSNKNFLFMIGFILINLLILIGLVFEWKMGMIEWLK
uniref:NADH dehydrogenase subunit 3 n=1 Tax=Amblyomma nitidum TaxID=1325864 RepID=UPI0030FEF8BB